MRTYAEALRYLEQFINYERNRTAKYSAETLNLDRMRDLLAALGNPHQAYPTVHIAGTKGKGSTAAMIAAILRAAGYRTGLYTSPHLHTFRERVRVDDALIAPESFAACVDAIEPHAAAVEGVTWFEIMTALGFLHFTRERIDAGVIEVGLGGRFDATNLLTPLVSVITSLSMDHMAWLGDTLEQIAFEKAGIIKPGVPVVSAPQQPEALAVIERVAGERGAPLTVVGRDVQYTPLPRDDSVETERGDVGERFSLGGIAFHIPLVGRHQIDNAAVAATAIRQAKHLATDDPAISRGLACVRWPGRFEVMRRQPPFIVDGAHNADSARRLAATLSEVFPDRRWTLVFGSSADKDIAAMLDALLPCADRVIVTRATNTRAADMGRIAEAVGARGRQPELAASVSEAVGRAIDDNQPIVITGSLFIVAEAREAWFRHIGAPQPDRDP